MPLHISQMSREIFVLNTTGAGAHDARRPGRKRIDPMPLPDLSEHDVYRRFPDVEEVSEPLRGGQKLVFACRTGESRFALKVMLSDLSADELNSGGPESPPTDEVFERARREVAILERCDCDSLPKAGPIQLSRFEHKGQPLIAFSEEYILGKNLNDVLSDEGRLANEATIQLGEDLNSAVEALWEQRKIHRDIKPQNIMRRNENGRFVLLDPGIAFDVDDVSLTGTGLIWHTKGYLAPELSNPNRKRDADCRSDFFLIGTVLYLASTGEHPFITHPSEDRGRVISNIINLDPPPPHDRCPDVSQQLSDLIMRLLAKRRHGRFRNSEMLRTALAACRRNS